MSNIKPKVELSTSTDLHLDLLADPTKIKPIKKNISLTNISEKSDEEDSHVIEQINKKESSVSSSSRKSSYASSSSNKSKSSTSSIPKNLFSNARLKILNNFYFSKYIK